MLEISHLKKSFKEVKAVNDISFSVEKGELFAFLGLNGAGKSTTINIICGRLKMDGGDVFVEGESIQTHLNAIKPKLGVVFQNSVLDDKLSVLDNLKSRALLYDLPKGEIDRNLKELSKRLEFEDILKRPLCKLSGGQRRRVDIARALLHRPKILILDEPTTGLDPKTRILVWEMVDSLRKKENLTVILTTHYMEEAAEADRILILDGGKVAATGTPNELKNRFANDFIKIYRFQPPLLEKLKERGYKVRREKSYLEVEIQTIGLAKEILCEFKEDIFDFEVIKGKMDNVFLNVTGKRLGEGI